MVHVFKEKNNQQNKSPCFGVAVILSSLNDAPGAEYEVQYSPVVLNMRVDLCSQDKSEQMILCCRRGFR